MNSCKKIWYSLLFIGCSQFLNAQHPDSLWAVVNDEGIDSTERIKSLHRLARYFMYNNPDSALSLAILEQQFAESMGDSNWIAFAYNLQGGTYTVLNDYTSAMDRFYRMLDIRLAMNDTTGTATAYNNIGNIYYYKGDYPKALDFYIRSLHFEELLPTQTGLAASYLNIGTVYARQNDFDQALKYFDRALELYTSLLDDNGIGTCYANMGNVYKQQDSLDLAKRVLLKAIPLLKKTRDEYSLATTYSNLANVYMRIGDNDSMFNAYAETEKISVSLGDQLGLANLWISRGTANAVLGKYTLARKECSKGLEIVQSLGALSGTQDACDCLYQAYKGLKQDDLALAYFERSNRLTDSLARDETSKQLQVMEFRNEVKVDSLAREEEKRALAQAHQLQLTKGKKMRNIFMVLGLLLVVLSVVLYRLFSNTRRSKENIEKEKSKADNLLLNILPADITEELMKSGKVEAQEFKDVTILFTDIVGFTEVSERLEPQQLLEALNDIYTHFDEIISKHGIQKIKSIGDAYMAAGGLPATSEGCVKSTIQAALDIQDYMRKRKQEREQAGLSAFEIRLGIHTGPVVAGIIGVKKFQYDVWGDTVNTASRMEKNGAAGRVNISQSTFDLIRKDPDFVFEQRKKIPVKGKGEMQMYFVSRRI